MRVLLIGNSSQTGMIANRIARAGHALAVLPNPAAHRIVSSVHAVNPELLVTATPLPTSVVQLLAERNIPVVGWSLWSDALQDETYQNRLLVMLSTAGLPVRNGGEVEEFCVVGWWNGLTFPLAYLSYNARHLMNGSVGPLMESAWSLSFPLMPKHPIFQSLLEPLVPFLNRISYRGSVVLRCVQHAGRPAVVRLDAGWQFDSDLSVWEVLRDPLQLLVPQTTLSAPALRGMDWFGSLHILNVGADVEVGESAAAHCITVACEGCVTARGRDWREVRRRLYRTVERLAPTAPSTTVSTIAYRTDYGSGLPSILTR